MKLQVQFKILFTGVALLLGAIVVISILSQRQSEEVNQAQIRRYQSYLIADELKQSSDDLTRLARTFGATADPKHESDYMNILAWRGGKVARPGHFMIKPNEIISQLDIMKELQFSQEEFEFLSQATKNSNDLVNTEVKAMNAVKGFEPDGKTPFNGSKFKGKVESAQALAIRTLFDKKYHEDKSKIMTPIDKFFKKLDERTRKEVSVVQELESQFFIALFALTLIAIITLISLVAYINKTTFKPLTYFSEKFKQTTNGDITVKIDIDSQNEIGELASAFNGFIQNLHKMLVSINKKSEEIESCAENVSKSSTDIKNNAETTANNVVQVTSESQNLSTNSLTIASSIQELSQSISSISENMNNSVEVGELAESFTDKTNSAIDNLSDKISEIGQVLGIISSIADQTNLLALNATIEAARAGELGKGFAVVANEVKELANQTQNSTKNINQIVVSINQAAVDAQTSIKSVTETIRQVKELQVSIASATEEQNAVTLEIERHITNAAHSTENISHEISSINKIASKTVKCVDQSQKDSQNLDRVAQELRLLVGVFKI